MIYYKNKYIWAEGIASECAAKYYYELNNEEA